MFEKLSGYRSKNRIRAAALVMACALLLFVFVSVFFIAHEAGHNCSGEDCPVCALIMQCENNLKQIGSGEAAAAPAAAVVLIFMTAQVFISAAASISTPISLKTRLNY